MLWKILSIVAALALGLGLWFSYDLQVALKAEKGRAERSKNNLEDVKRQFAKGNESKEAQAKALEEATKLRDELKEKVAKANEDVDLKSKEATAVITQLEEVKKQVAQLEEQIAKSGDIQRLMSEVKQLDEQVKVSNETLATRQQDSALGEGRVTKIRDQIRGIQEREAEQKRGSVTKDFTARVSQAFPGFGFVILNKGNRSGLFANANLEVKRGSEVIAKLRVRDVEQGNAVADLVPGSMDPENEIRSGDLVVAGQEQAAPTVVTPAATTGATDGAEAAAPADGAAAPAGMADDPFGAAPPADGAMQPAADPAAPADPFGAPVAPADGAMQPAPEAPAPAAPADPFAPAPAADAAPAPAPAAPADPFAPAAGDAMMGQ